MERGDTDERIREILRLNREFRESPDPIRFAQLLAALDALCGDPSPARLLGPRDGVAHEPEPDDDAG